MDQMSQELEFLDLTGLVDKERVHVQSVLYSRNPDAAYLQLPWPVSSLADVDPYQQSAEEVQWSHKQQYESEDPVEIINYDAEACDTLVEDEGAIEQPMEYQSASNIIPATSVFMSGITCYPTGIMNHMPYNSVPPSQMYSPTPANDLNSSQQPRRSMGSKMGMKGVGMHKMSVRFRPPPNVNVETVEQVMSHQPQNQLFYPVPPQYPYYPAPPNAMQGHQMSSAQHAAGSPVYMHSLGYPGVYYQPAAFCSPPLPMNPHTHEPLELSQTENVLVKPEYVEGVPIVSVENSVPYDNNLTDDISNISSSSDVNISLNNDSSNLNNNNYDISSIKDKVVKSNEISASSIEFVSSDLAVDEVNTSCVRQRTSESNSISQPTAPVVNKSVPASNSCEAKVDSSESSNPSIHTSNVTTAPTIKTSVGKSADGGNKVTILTSPQSVAASVSNKSDLASVVADVGKVSNSSFSSVANSTTSNSENIQNTSNLNNDSKSVSPKNIHVSKGKDTIVSGSPSHTCPKPENKAVSPVATPAVASNGPSKEPVAITPIPPRSYAAMLSGLQQKLAPATSPSSFSPESSTANVDQPPTASNHKTVNFLPSASVKTAKPTQQQLQRSQSARSAPKHRSAPASKSNSNEPPSASNDVYLQRIAELLSTYKLDHKVVNLLPRGLNNRSSYCYINATLQALLACPPLYNLLKSISSVLGDSKQKAVESSIPFISSLVTFVNEFSPLPNNVLPRKPKQFPPPGQKQSKSQTVDSDPKTDPAFEPGFIYKMLASLNSDSGAAFNVEGRQEDAEEFLSCLLNGLNDEMIELRKYCEHSDKKSHLSNGDIMVNGDASQQVDHGDEWQRVKAKNKSAIVRDANFERTPLSDIFRGKLKSQVSRSGGVTSCNIQPFFTLQLDIEKAKSVTEALGMLVDRDQLEGVTCSKTNQEVEAWQKMTLEELPCVLLLHLKCFDFKQQVQSCGKIIKTIDFPINLELDNKWMSYRKIQNRKYKLFAVVYHEGKEATKGHYIADVYHYGYESWIRYDDSNVKFIDESEFLKPKPPRVPYLLYYKRVDTLVTPVNAKTSSTLKNR